MYCNHTCSMELASVFITNLLACLLFPSNHMYMSCTQYSINYYLSISIILNESSCILHVHVYSNCIIAYYIHQYESSRNDQTKRTLQVLIDSLDFGYLKNKRSSIQYYSVAKTVRLSIMLQMSQHFIIMIIIFIDHISSRIDDNAISSNAKCNYSYRHMETLAVGVS